MGRSKANSDVGSIILGIIMFGILGPVVLGFLGDPNTTNWDPSIVCIFQVLAPILAIAVGGILLYTNR